MSRGKGSAIAMLTGILMAAPGAAGREAPSPPRPERVDLANGMRVLVVSQPHLPMVVMAAVVDAGARCDDIGKEGLANLTAELLSEGTTKHTSAEVHEQMDFLGARFSSSAGDDFATVTLTVLRKNLDEGFSLFAESLLSPAFEEKEFERKRAEALAGLEADDENPGAVAHRAFRRVLFGDGPYRHDAAGWKESVARLERSDVVGFYGASYRPDRTFLVVAGDVTVDGIRSRAEKLFGEWTVPGEAPAIGETKIAPGPRVERIDRDLTQANLVWGHGGVARSNPDFDAIRVMNYILGGGGFSSRMMESIRVREGLAYSVYSQFRGTALRSSFQVGLQTKSASTGRALELVRSEIRRIQNEPVSETELDDAKKYLTGSFPLKFDSNSEMALFYAAVEFYGLGDDYAEQYPARIEAVTREDVQRVAKKYLHPDERTLVVVGKQSEIEIPDLE